MRYVLLLLLLALPLEASAARVLTLDQALAIAVEKNYDIAKAGEYAKYVQGKYVEERSAVLPQVGFNAGITAARDNGQPAFAGGGINQYDRSVGLSLSQPLYTWGKIGAAIRAAEIGKSTAKEQLRMAQQAARRDVTTTFCNVLLAKEMLRLSTDNLRQKERHAEEARKKFAAGVATDYDVLAAEVALENTRPALIKAENLVRVTRERLRFLLVLDEEVEAAGSLEPQLTALPSLETVQKTALTLRPELLDLGYRIGIYNELVTIAAADNKPRLDLKGNAGWHQLEMGNITNDGAAWNVGVYLTFPFFDGLKTSGRVQQARSDLVSKEIEKRQLQESIKLEARTALNELQEASEILTALSGTVRQAERLLQMAEKGFELGVKIRLEVDDAQNSLLQAQINRAKAATDYMIARANLDWVMGRLGEQVN